MKTELMKEGRFRKSRLRPCQLQFLLRPDFIKPFNLVNDESENVVGDVLSLKQGENERKAGQARRFL